MKYKKKLDTNEMINKQSDVSGVRKTGPRDQVGFRQWSCTVYLCYSNGSVSTSVVLTVHCTSITAVYQYLCNSDTAVVCFLVREGEQFSLANSVQGRDVWAS